MLQNYRIRLVSPPCNPSSETVNAVVAFDEDLTELLPYLNAALGPGLYNREVPFLRLVTGGRPITIHPHNIAIAKVRDRQQANEILARLKGQINSVNDRRAEIQPSYESIGQFTALDVFKLLPRSNCGQCGAATCLAFAVGVAQAERDVQDCPPLLSEEFAGQRQKLLELVGMK